MNETRRSRRFWPSPLQEQLLVAALAEPVTGAAAWTALRPQLDLDRLEPGSFELLPLISRNLLAAGSATTAREPLLPRLKGIHRRSFVKNTLLLERLKATAAELDAASVPALVLEGPPFALRYYGDLGLRPTSFFHLLVDASSIPRALARLPRAGWASHGDGGDGRWAWGDGEGNGCTIRSSLSYDFIVTEPFEALQAAPPQELLGETALRVPSATGSLLAACVVGARRQPIPTIQWLVDAAMILRQTAVDWDRLVDLAITSGQTVRVREALAYLTRLPGVPVDNDALGRLARVQVGRRERTAYMLASGRTARLGALPEIVAEHLAATTHESAAHTITSFPGRLRDRWGLERNRELPSALVRRAYTRLTGGAT